MYTRDASTFSPLAAPAVAPSSLRDKPVLVAASGSAESWAAVSVADALARERGARPEVLQVFDARIIAAPLPLPSLLAITDDLLGEEPHEAQKRDLRAALSTQLGATCDWPLHVRIGTPAGAILREAERIGAALLVTGLRRHGAVARAVRDETTLHVMRAARAPVLAVAPSLTALPRRVVVGIDFSRASVRAARAALSLVADAGTVILAYARPEVTIADEASEGPEVIHSQGVPAAFERLREELLLTERGRVAAPAAPARVRIESAVLIGDPADELCSLAERAEADVIAVGSHRHETVERWLFGSVTTELVRDGRVSMLVVPAAAVPERSARWARAAARLEVTQ